MKKIKIILILSYVLLAIPPYFVYQRISSHVPPSFSQISIESIDGLYSFNGFSANRLCNLSIFAQFLDGTKRVEEITSLFPEAPRYIIKQDEKMDYYCVLSNEESLLELVKKFNDSLINYILCYEVLLLFLFWYLLRRVLNNRS